MQYIYLFIYVYIYHQMHCINPCLTNLVHTFVNNIIVLVWWTTNLHAIWLQTVYAIINIFAQYIIFVLYFPAVTCS